MLLLRQVSKQRILLWIGNTTSGTLRRTHRVYTQISTAPTFFGDFSLTPSWVDGIGRALEEAWIASGTSHTHTHVVTLYHSLSHWRACFPAFNLPSLCRKSNQPCEIESEMHFAGSEVGPAVGDKEVVAAAFRSVFGVSGAGASVHCEVTLLTWRIIFDSVGRVSEL